MGDETQGILISPPEAYGIGGHMQGHHQSPYHSDDTASTSSGISSGSNSPLSNSAEWGKTSSSSSSSTPRISLFDGPKVSASVVMIKKGGWFTSNEIFTYNIPLECAVLPRDITSISAVLPFIKERILAQMVNEKVQLELPKVKTQMDLAQIKAKAEVAAKAFYDELYGAHKHITLHRTNALGRAEEDQRVVHAGSARALYNLFLEIIDGKHRDMETLIINGDDKAFQNAHNGLGGLEKINGIYKKMTPECFPKLKTIQYEVTPNSQKISGEIASLMGDGALSKLTVLDLQYESFGPHLWVQQGINDKVRLSGIYFGGMTGGNRENPLSPRNFDQLSLVAMTDTTTEIGEALDKHYATFGSQSNLKSLVIHDVMAGYGVEQEIETFGSVDIVRRNGYEQLQDNRSYFVDIDYVKPTEEANAWLAKVLADNKQYSQLQSFKLYTWCKEVLQRHGETEPEHLLEPLFAHQTLASFMWQGWLPQLNHIDISSDGRSFNLGQIELDPKEAMNTNGLLNTVLASVSAGLIQPITTLTLTLPEVDGYQAWLDKMAQGQFSVLTKLSYRIPDRHIGESEAVHQKRVLKALETINVAIHLGMVPDLTQLSIEGHLPSSVAYLAHRVYDVDSFKIMLESLKEEIQPDTVTVVQIPTYQFQAAVIQHANAVAHSYA